MKSPTFANSFAYTAIQTIQTVDYYCGFLAFCKHDGTLCSGWNFHGTCVSAAGNEFICFSRTKPFVFLFSRLSLMYSRNIASYTLISLTIQLSEKKTLESSRDTPRHNAHHLKTRTAAGIWSRADPNGRTRSTGMVVLYRTRSPHVAGGTRLHDCRSFLFLIDEK